MNVLIKLRKINTIAFNKKKKKEINACIESAFYMCVMCKKMRERERAFYDCVLQLLLIIEQKISLHCIYNVLPVLNRFVIENDPT